MIRRISTIAFFLSFFLLPNSSVLGAVYEGEEIPEHIQKIFQEHEKATKEMEQRRSLLTASIELGCELLDPITFIGEPIIIRLVLKNKSNNIVEVPSDFRRNVSVVKPEPKEGEWRDIDDPEDLVVNLLKGRDVPVAWLPGPWKTNDKNEDAYLQSFPEKIEPGKVLERTLPLYPSGPFQSGRYVLQVEIAPLKPVSVPVTFIDPVPEVGSLVEVVADKMHYYAWFTKRNERYYLFAKALAPEELKADYDEFHWTNYKPETAKALETELSFFGHLSDKEPVIEFYKRVAPNSPKLTDQEWLKKMDGKTQISVSLERAVYNRRIEQTPFPLQINSLVPRPDGDEMVVVYSVAPPGEKEIHGYVAYLRPYTGELLKQEVLWPVDNTGSMEVVAGWPKEQGQPLTVNVRKGDWQTTVKFAGIGEK